MATNNIWLDDTKSNRFIQTYLQGYLDMSGGDLRLRNQNIFVNDGDISLNGILSVASDTSLNSQLFVANDVSMDTVLMVGGDVSLNSKLFVANDVSMDTVLMVGGDVSLNSKLFVANDVSMDTVLMVGGDVSLNSKLFVVNDVSMDTVLMVGGDVSLNSKLFVANDVSMDTVLMVGGDVSLNSKLFVTNDVSMDTVLMVGGDVSLNSKLFVVNDVSMDTVLMVGGDVSLNSKLFVANDVSMDTVLMVGGDVSLNSKLFVTNDVSMDTIIMVGGDVSLNSNLFVANDVSMDTVLMVGGDVSLNSNLFVANDVSMDTVLMVGGDVSLNSNLFVANDVSMDTVLMVGGDVSLNSKLFVANDVSMNTILAVGSDVSLNSKLFVANDVSMDTVLMVGSDVSLNNKLFVTNDVSMNSILSVGSKLIAGGDVSCNGKLIVGLDASLNGNLSLGGNFIPANIITLGYGKISRTLDVSNEVVFGSTLDVSGPTTIRSSLYVVDDVSIDTGMTVGGDVSFNSTMTVSGDVSFHNNLSVQNNLNIVDGTVTNKQIITVSNLPYYALGPTPSFINNEFDLYSFNHSGDSLSVLYGRYVISASSILTDNINPSGVIELNPSGPTDDINPTDNINPSNVFDGHNNTYWASSGNQYVNSIYIGSINTEIAEINGNVPTISGEYIEVTLPFHIRLREISVGCTNDRGSTSGTNNANIKINGLSIVAENNNIWYQVYSSNPQENLNIHDVSSIAIDTDIYANKFRYIITKITDQVFNNAIVSDLSFSGDVIGSTIHMNNGSIGIGADNPRSALEVVGDVTISKVHSGKNTSDTDVEHGRISWCGKDNHKTGSYIRSYFEKDTLDTSGNLAFGTSDGIYDAVDRFILHSTGVNHFISDVSMNANLTVSGDVSMNSKLSVGNIAYFNEKVVIGKNTIDDVNNHTLDVSGSIRTTNLSITKDIATTGTVGVGKISFDDGTNTNIVYPIIQSSSDKEGIEFVTNDAINFHISKSGDISMNSNLVVTGDISLNKKLLVNGDVSFNSKLFVEGTAILDSDASMNAGLVVAEDVSLNSNLNVVGNSQFTTVTTNGDISANTHFRLGKNLQVNGDASFNQHVEISGNLVVNGVLDAQSYENINTKNTTVENYTLIFSEDISLNGRIDVSGGANINNRFIVDPEAGNVKIIDQNITIGKEIYLDKLISEAVFSEANMTTGPTGKRITEAASESEKIVSFSNATYKVQASSIHTGSSNNNPRHALKNNDKQWTTTIQQYSESDGVYTGSQNTKYKDNGEDDTTVYNISGEWIQITFPYETVIDSFQLHTSEFQLPKHARLLADTGNGTDISWMEIAEYNPDNVSPNSMVNTDTVNPDIDQPETKITTRVIRLVIDQISTSNGSTANYHENNLAIRFLNFSGTYKDTGILYGSGNSQSAGNTGIGFSTLTGNVTGKANIAIGSYALAETTDSNNIGIGYNSLEITTIGGKNIGIGSNALSDNVKGYGNAAIGYLAGINNVDGSLNSFIGYNSGTDGNNPYSYSTALGQNAKITDNHQIVLGTVNDTISIPGDVSYININRFDVSNAYVSNAYVSNMDVSDATIKTLTVPSGNVPVQFRSGLEVNNRTTLINAGLIVSGNTIINNDVTSKGRLDVTGDVSVNNIMIHGKADILNINVSDISSNGSNNLKSGETQILRLTQGSSSTYTNNSYINFEDGNNIQIKALDKLSIGVGNATLVLTEDGRIVLTPSDGEIVSVLGGLRTTGTISTSGLSIAAEDITVQSGTSINTGVLGDDASGGPMITSSPTEGMNLFRIGIMDGNDSGPSGVRPKPATLGTFNPFQIECPIYDYAYLTDVNGNETSHIQGDLRGQSTDASWGRVTVGYNMIVKGDLSNNSVIYGKSLVMDSSSILHDLKATNDTSLNNLYVTNDVLFNSNLNVNDNVAFASNLDVDGTTKLNSFLDVSGISLFQNGTFEVNDNSFNLTDIPLSITNSAFGSNTKILYSQYTGSERVFNGRYDVSASTNQDHAWKVFNNDAVNFWQSTTGSDKEAYSSGVYVGTSDISHVTYYYTDDINVLTGISGEYIEFTFPFSLDVSGISLGNNTIGSAKLVGEVNNHWKHILDISIEDNESTVNVSDISNAIVRKLRLVVMNTRKINETNSTVAKIVTLSFLGDVIGSKFHISEGNVGIGTTTPRSALDVDGDIILSKPHSGLNNTGNLIEHGRISWLGRQGTTDKTSSYIRSYYENDTYDTCGNLAFGTSDGNNNATDHIILHSSGKTSFTSDISVDGLTIGTGSGGISTNTATGYQALYKNETGSSNVANGYQALYSNTDGSMNVANGYQALYSNTDGSMNVANGYQALYSNTDGSMNVANGYQALFLNKTGISNVANGYQALHKNTTGSSNVAIGANSGLNNTTGNYNTFLGPNTDIHPTNGNFLKSTAIGYNAKITASNQIVLGTTSEIVTMPNKLGIGTTSPSAKLHIHQSYTSSGIYPAGEIKFSTESSTHNWQLASIESYVKANDGTVNNYPGGLVFKTKAPDNTGSSLSLPVERMVIDSNGNVGIGTTAPSEKLHVSGNAALNSNKLFIGNDPNYGDNLIRGYDGGNGGKLRLKGGWAASGDSNGTAWSTQNQNYIDIYGYEAFSGDTAGGINLVTQNTSRMFVNHSGNVGIGTTAPGNYKLNVNGNVNATSYNAASDYRIKENVIPISDTSYNIDNIRPVTYTNTKMEKQDFGVIAHELQEQIPFLVTGEKDDEHHQSVNYNGLIGLLLNEVQQLKKRVQELEQSKP